MVEWFRTFVTDKSFFEMTLRTVFMAAAGAVQAGSLPVSPKYWWVPAAASILVSTKPK